MRLDWIDGAARLVAALTLVGAAALVAPPLVSWLGPATAQTPFYLAIAITASTLGCLSALATIGASAVALLLQSPSVAAGALSYDDSLAVTLFVATGVLIAAALGRLRHQRERAHSFAQLFRARSRERDDAREAREALRAQMLAQHGWYATALDALDEAVVAADVEGRVQFINAAAQRLTQRSAAVAIGRRIDHVLRLASEQGGVDVTAPMREALARGDVLAPTGTLTLAVREGTPRAVRFAVTPVRSHDGAVLGGVVVLRDASRQRRAERMRTRLLQSTRQAESIAVAARRSLELAERKFAAFMARLPFPAYIIAESGDMMFVNEAGRRAPGWQEALAERRTSDEGECTFDVPEEARRYIDMRFPIRADGRAWTGGVAIDISDRARAARALRERSDELDALFRHVPLPMWIARGIERPVIRCNEAAQALCAGERGRGPILQCIAERRAVTNVDLEIAAGDGTMRTLRMTAVPLVHARGGVRGALAFAIDATPLAEYEAIVARVSATSR